jgi:hypothetical protein
MLETEALAKFYISHLICASELAAFKTSKFKFLASDIELMKKLIWNPKRYPGIPFQFPKHFVENLKSFRTFWISEKVYWETSIGFRIFFKHLNDSGVSKTFKTIDQWANVILACTEKTQKVYQHFVSSY